MANQKKSIRDYRLIVERQDGLTIEINRPFTLDFTLVRNSLSSSNDGTFRISNLKPDTRAELRFNFYNQSQKRQVILQAGYNDSLSEVFNGNMRKAWSVREGTTFISQIEALDAGFAFGNAHTELPFSAGTPIKTVVTALIASLKPYGVALGAVGNSFPGVIRRGAAYSGNTIGLLRELTNGNFYIDNGKAYALGVDEVLLPSTIINSASGLLGTPTREQTTVTIEMLFEPKLFIGQLITLESETATNFNTQYKVVSITHHGTISESVCGDAISIVGLQPAIASFVPVSGT
jgi:hypothetical protein